MIDPLVLSFASAALIVTGVALVVRDMRRGSSTAAKRTFSKTAAIKADKTVTARPASGPARANAPEADVSMTPVDGNAANAEVTIVHRIGAPDTKSPPLPPLVPPPPRATRAGRPPATPGFAELQSSVAAINAETMAENLDTAPDDERTPAVESRWATAAQHIESAIDQLNTAMTPVGLQVARAGESGWSFKNRGFGTYRRIMIGGRSLAWLRTEADQHGNLALKVRAHAAEHAMLNATALVPPAPRQSSAVVDAVALALKPSAEYAAWRAPTLQSEAEARTAAWLAIDKVAHEAAALTWQAFKEVGAELAEQAPPAWDAANARHTWPLKVIFGGQTVTIVHVDLVAEAVEVWATAVHRLPQEGQRRQSMPADRLNAHDLAQAIAAAAWPSLEAALNAAAEAVASV